MPDRTKILLRDARLYLILDTQVNDYAELLRILRSAVHAGVDIVQLRDKSGSSSDILRFANDAMTILQGKIPFVINDHIELARISRAQGVHLGQEDLPVQYAREILGPKAIIGVSCQNQEHIRRAQSQGADYIGLGSVFKTKTKPDRAPMDLRAVSEMISLSQVPVFAIGGIDLENTDRLLDHGINRIAVCRAICKADQVEIAVRSLKRKLVSGHHLEELAETLQ